MRKAGRNLLPQLATAALRVEAIDTRRHERLARPKLIGAADVETTIERGLGKGLRRGAGSRDFRRVSPARRDRGATLPLGERAHREPAVAHDRTAGSCPPASRDAVCRGRCPRSTRAGGGLALCPRKKIRFPSGKKPAGSPCRCSCSTPAVLYRPKRPPAPASGLSVSPATHPVDVRPRANVPSAKRAKLVASECKRFGARSVCLSKDTGGPHAFARTPVEKKCFTGRREIHGVVLQLEV